MIITVTMSDKDIGTGIHKRLHDAFPEAIIAECSTLGPIETQDLLEKDNPVILFNINKSYVPSLIIGKILNI